MSSSKLEDDTSRALAAARRYVQAGVRSRHEVTTYLRRRGVTAETASRAIATLGARGLLDDRACARLWADQWARHGYASAAIRAKLAAKGLEEETIDHAITQLQMSLGDEARAREMVVRRARPRAGRRQERARVARTLASRGFDSDLIEQVLNESFDPLVSS